MKAKNLFFFIVAALVSSCGKKEDTNSSNPTTVSYINTNAGSSWTYHELDSSSSTPKSSDYTVTSTPNDTTINSKTYHVYSYSYGGSQYLNLTGNNYYQFDSVPINGGGSVERIYLEDNLAVGGTWSQPFTLTIQHIPVPLTVTNKVAEKLTSLVVNNITYNNVVHVSSSISSSFIPAASLTSSIDSYYAENFGLIKNNTLVNLNYMGFNQNVNTKTQLTSAILK
ncbi:MAG TPA: hypothetical protein VIJ75_09920 [Hanamia sp.]